jgi:hypothetical protein
MGSVFSGIVDFVNPVNQLTKYNPAHQVLNQVAPGAAGAIDNAVEPARTIWNSGVYNFKDAVVGGVKSLAGGGGDESSPAPEESSTGNPDDARTREKTILEGGHDRRRRGFSSGSSSLLQGNSRKITTLLGG